MRSLIFVPFLALVACGGGTDSRSTSVENMTAATPVAGKAAPASQQWSEIVAATPEGGYRMGNPDAPIKLVEYGDRLCPACRAFAAEGYQPLVERYVSTGKVSYEFRDYLIHGAPVLAMAVLGRCGGPGPFFAILDQSYAAQDAFMAKLQAIPPAQQQAWQSQAPAQVLGSYAAAGGILDFMKQRGMTEAKARACLADQKTIDAVVKVTEDANTSGEVTGTPTFIVNGTKVDGITWKEVEPALKAAGAR